VRLSVKTTQEQNQLRTIFEITDSGIGMAPDELKKIFNQFEQANNEISKNFGGTGLGLNIVKALVDVQKGDIDVHSEPGIGSTFVIALNFTITSHLPRPKEKISDQHHSLNTEVLVVDDDAMILKLCGLILKKNKVKHTLFNDPLALVYRDANPSITHVLIDIRMPKMNGVQVCKALKSKYPASTKFIALTAHVLPDERNSLLHEGFDAILTKPFHEAELLKTLNVITIHEQQVSRLPDFSVVRQMTMGDESLFQSVMQQFVDESDEDYIILRESLKLRDKKQVREIVHKLAGRFGQMGVYDLSNELHEIEVELVEGRSVEELENAIMEVMNESLDLIQNIRLTTITHMN
jgi:CheY-like chemotaxis protein